MVPCFSHLVYIGAVKVALHVGDENALYGEQAPGHLVTEKRREKMVRKKEG